jgi:hypothetical protein
MRQKQTRQMSLFSVTARHDIGQELKDISTIFAYNLQVIARSDWNQPKPQHEQKECPESLGPLRE